MSGGKPTRVSHSEGTATLFRRLLELTNSSDVFVGDAASEWKANKKLELSTCMCTEDTGCDENCQNRYMFYECDSGNCRLGPECGNRNFSELKARTKAGGKYNIGVEVIKTADRGYGVRSNRTFEPNQIIVEYTGEIITQFECEKRMRTVYKNNDVSDCVCCDSRWYDN